MKYRSVVRLLDIKNHTDRPRVAAGAHAIYKKYCLFAVMLLLALVASAASAQEDQAQERQYDIRGAVDSLSWLPGENYNILAGTMNHRMTDLVYNGNGLPITVVRSDQKLGVGPGEMFHMGLDLPVLSARHLDGSGRLGRCDEGRLLAPSGDYRNRRQSPFVFNFQGKAITFFTTLESEKPNADGIRRFPVQADYVSPANWYIVCVDGTLPRVYSPDGMIYTMGKQNSWRTRAYTPAGQAASMTKDVYRVTEVQDPNGNRLVYTYHRENLPVSDSGINSNNPLLSIHDPRDGRRVTFEYERRNNRNYLRSVVSNAQPNPHVVKYSYPNSTSLQVEYDETRTINYTYSDGSLVKIVYPHGGSVVYSYNPSKFSVSHYAVDPDQKYGKYSALISRVVSTGSGRGAVFNFKFNPASDNSISRFIETPSTTMEYNFSKVNMGGKYLVPRAGITANQGRLNYIRNYGRVLDETEIISANAGSLKPVWERRFSYSYLEGSSVTTQYPVESDIQMSGASTIVTTQVQTRVYRSGGKDPLVFTRKFTSFDEFGKPLEINETSGRGLTRTIKFQYLNGYSRWIRSLLYSKHIVGSDFVSFSYNPFGSITRVVKNNVVQSVMEYHSGGLLASHSDALGNTHKYKSYSYGIPMYETDPNGRTMSRWVNSDGTIQIVIDWGATSGTYYYYDKARRVRRVVSPERSVSDQFVSWNGMNVRSVRQGQHTTSQTFDGFGREVLTSSGVSGSTLSIESEYDDEGRLVFQSYPFMQGKLSAGTVFIYDGLGRVIQQYRQGASGEDSRWSYDGMEVTMTEGRGNKTMSSYDSYGSPSTEYLYRFVDANGTSTHYDRDSAYRLTRLRTANQTRSYVYNDKKQLSVQWIPESGTTEYRYLANGQLLSEINGNYAATYSYEPDGQISSISTTGDGESTERIFKYNSRGLLSELISKSGDRSNTWSYAYDDESKLETESLSIDGRDFTLTYDYDNYSNLESITYPNGRKYNYEPDELGRATKVIDDSGEVVYDSIAYHPNGIPHVMERNRHLSVTKLDGMQRRVVQQLIRKSDSQRLVDQNYQYDQNSNLSKINDRVRNQTKSMGYDNANRLVSVSSTSGDRWRFTYNIFDDITRTEHGSDWARYYYDDNTRHLLKIESQSPTKRYAYNGQGDMISHESLSAENTLVHRKLIRNSAGQISRLYREGEASNSMQYEYDGNGRRVKKDRNGAIYTVYDANGVLRFREDVGAGVKSEYLYVAGSLIARRDSDDGFSAGGVEPLQTRPASPTGLRANVANGKITLGWNTVTQAEKYNIYRNDQYLTTVSNAASFTDSTPVQGKNSYSIVAIDEDASDDDKYSIRSEPLSVDVTAGPAPTAMVSDFRAETFSSTTAQLYWTPAKDPTAGTAVEYEVYRDGVFFQRTSNSGNLWLSNMAANETYRFQIVAVYSSGIRSDMSSVISLLMAENQRSN